MDDHRRGASRGTELGLQAASLAPHPISRTNQPLVRSPAEGLHTFLHTSGARWRGMFVAELGSGDGRERTPLSGLTDDSNAARRVGLEVARQFPKSRVA